MTPHSTARIYRATRRNLARLARALRRGELVAVPTETVYGLAANALEARACRKIFRAKRRPVTDPLIVHIHSLAQLVQIAEPNDAALQLARVFWPGPLTIVLPKQPSIPGIVTAGRPSVAVRMPKHPVLRRLLGLAAIPVAAPSANPFGYVSPTSAKHVQAGLGSKIAYILDGGESRIGLESTIVDLRDPRAPRLLRPGAITRAELERVLGRPVRSGAAAQARGHRGQLAPGQLPRHYSPRTSALLHAKIVPSTARRSPANEAWVFFARPPRLKGPNIFWLDEHGRPERAARRLFDTLRRVDAAGFARIHLERAPGRGLADAINDRLQRAASLAG